MAICLQRNCFKDKHFRFGCLPVPSCLTFVQIRRHQCSPLSAVSSHLSQQEKNPEAQAFPNLKTYRCFGLQRHQYTGSPEHLEGLRLGPIRLEKTSSLTAYLNYVPPTGGSGGQKFSFTRGLDKFRNCRRGECHISDLISGKFWSVGVNGTILSR